jgi:hypothetical protein
MTRPRQDSSRDLLEELEDGWATPPAPTAPAAAPRAAARPAPDEDLEALDEGWLDDLFPGEEDEADEEEEADEPEAELPDERLDPAAFAAAKKARDERAALKKERKRAKAEAKRARQKARAAAIRQKQKTKKSRAGAARSPESGRVLPSDVSVAATPDGAADAANADAAENVVAEPKGRGARSAAPVRRASTMASIKLLAIVLAVLLALAAFAAAIIK